MPPWKGTLRRSLSIASENFNRWNRIRAVFSIWVQLSGSGVAATASFETSHQLGTSISPSGSSGSPCPTRSGVRAKRFVLSKKLNTPASVNPIRLRVASPKPCSVTSVSSK